MAEAEIKKRVGFGLKTEIDILQGSDFATGTFVSGNIASGLCLHSGIVGMKLRPVNLELSNAEPGWIQVEFRDGTAGGTRVLGPYKIDALSEKRVGYDMLVGRYFTSAIFTVLLSGYNATPISTGIKINMSFAKEPVTPIE